MPSASWFLTAQRETKVTPKPASTALSNPSVEPSSIHTFKSFLFSSGLNQCVFHDSARSGAELTRQQRRVLSPLQFDIQVGPLVTGWNHKHHVIFHERIHMDVLAKCRPFDQGKLDRVLD